ncbi:hypothetical protein [Kribbella sp. C-35]|uniref:hypothetical protein n=1 Tax=Kribbella sp. C-35 TaxID=2789276 RepID=UPI00397CF3CB
MDGSSERTKRAIDTVFGATGAAEARPAPDESPNDHAADNMWSQSNGSPCGSLLVHYNVATDG